VFRAQFSEDSSFLYLIAGEHARSKVFVLPVPPTPTASTAHPDLSPYYQTPRALTRSGAATGLQVLPNKLLLFSLSSMRYPNVVILLRNLDVLETELAARRDVEHGIADGVLTWDGRPEQVTFMGVPLPNKQLRAPDDMWFEGAEAKQVHGWVLKPYGWKAGEKKKWPAVLLIHGGVYALRDCIPR